MYFIITIATLTKDKLPIFFIKKGSFTAPPYCQLIKNNLKKKIYDWLNLKSELQKGEQK